MIIISPMMYNGYNYENHHDYSQIIITGHLRPWLDSSIDWWTALEVTNSYNKHYNILSSDLTWKLALLLVITSQKDSSSRHAHLDVGGALRDDDDLATSC